MIETFRDQSLIIEFHPTNTETRSLDYEHLVEEWNIQIAAFLRLYYVHRLTECSKSLTVSFWTLK